MRIIEERMFLFRYLNFREEKNKRDGVAEEKPDRPTGCFGSVRPGGAQPQHRTRLSGLNGLGREVVEEEEEGVEKREKVRRNDFYPVQM